MGVGEGADYDLVIIGGGPAGSAAAIHATRLTPESPLRILLLDKARFPRVKICGGGIVQRSDYLMRRLGVRLDVPTTRIDAARFVFPQGEVTLNWPKLFRVVRREQFDFALLQHTRSLGVTVREGTPVTGLMPDGDGVLVHTAHETLRARVVIGADGANGIARRTVVPDLRGRPMVGIETFTQEIDSELAQGARQRAVFDFRCTASGIQGYSWDFPTGTAETPLVNRGIFHTHMSLPLSGTSLKGYLVQSLNERGIHADPNAIKGHPAHMYDPSLPCSAPHILLAGDAIGVEPLLGEGISSALETGMMAAAAACQAIETGDYSFQRYADRIRSSSKGRSMRFKRFVARRFYEGRAKRWVLLGAVGISGTYTGVSQAWDAVSGLRSGALPR